MIPENNALGLAAAMLTFTVWGVGVNVASVSYLSLLSEESQGYAGWRSRTVSIMFTTMILATIVTSIGLSRMLDPFSEAALYTAFGVIWLIATLFVILGAAGIEPAPEPNQRVQNSADNPATALRALANNATARRFFVYLLLVLISIHAQDVLLEPYGADVLGMSVSATSRLTAIWGVGVLLTMVGGLPLVRRAGKKRAANIGAVVAAIGFAAIVLTGLLQQVNLFMVAVFVLGLGGGLMTVSNLSFMLDMTVTGAAGLYMGAWGVANFAGQSLGSISSGLIRDVAYTVTGSNLFGYVIVFGLEILGLIIAMILFRTIDVAEFQQEATASLPELLALAGD
jgi:BCD family chlorophyll transporter-like MFS transporter